MKRARARARAGTSAREDSDDSSEEEEEGSVVKKKPKPSEDSDFADPSQVGSEDINTALVKNEKSALSEAEVGVIEKLVLINFMCHRRLDLSFSPNVNFILGRNGSGKSAIMTGIVVGLGGNARNTERGRSLKQFVKTGEKFSEVRVHLRNRGTEAYQHDVYGDTIIVERTISSDGSGSYKLKSSGGKTISTKKEELIGLLDHCGVQVDNPVSLLNQDTSRNFLQKSKPSDKYKLFMKATHLEQIAVDYIAAEEQQGIMKDAILDQEKLLPEYESQAKVLEEKVDTFHRLSDMEEEVDRLGKELQWALVRELQKAIVPIERECVKEMGRIPRNEKKIKDTEAEMSKLKGEEKEVSEQLTKAVGEASTLHEEREAAAGEKRRIEQALRDLSNKTKRVGGEIREKENEKKCLETARDSCIAMSQRDVAGEKELREKELQELQKKLARVEGEIATAENDRKQFDGAVKRGTEKERELRRKVETEKGSLRSCRERLSRLKSSHDDSLAMFGENMKALVTALQRNHSKFKYPPIGPLGAMIKLKDYTWTTAVEQVVKRNLLYSFLVDNHRDEHTLRRVINTVYSQDNRGGRHEPKPDVVCSPFQDTVYDTRANRPQCNHPTVLDLLDVRDPNVMNVLIDQINVESILLIRTRSEANRVITHERPRGVKAAYTLDGDMVLHYAHYSNKFGRLGILRESVEAAVREEEARFAGLERDLGGLQREVDGVVQEVARDQRCVQDAAGKVRRRTSERRSLKAKIEELLNAQEEEEPEEDIATYDAEISELEEAIARLRDQQKVFAEQRKKLENQNLECFRKYDLCNKETDTISAKVIDLKGEVGAFAHKKKELEKKVKFYEDRIREIRVTVAELESQVSEQKRKVEERRVAAEEVCPEILTERTPKSINSEREKLKRRIAQELPEHSEQERIMEQYKEAKDLYEKTFLAVKNQRKVLKKLQASLQFRKTKYKNLQERITRRTRFFFTNFLQQRDYEGTLKFNHDKERLEIEVMVDRHTIESRSTKNTKALSGGERSFTTVCFIMSLWEAMEAPFRCLDEFDVFMDMMNRRISMRLMLEHAEDQQNRQFIFFTPQDMSSMGIKIDSRKVKVLKLNPPERGSQSVLGLRE